MCSARCGRCRRSARSTARPPIPRRGSSPPRRGGAACLAWWTVSRPWASKGPGRRAPGAPCCGAVVFKPCGGGGASTAAAVVQARSRHGARPFVFPGMGSHGGAPAEGQVEVLAALGVTEARVGAPVVSSMDVVELGHLADGSGVYWDRRAHAADAVVVIGRVKPHTLFRGPFESGLIKMAVIGAGKQRGAMSIHATGPKDLGPRLREAWEIVRARTPIMG